MTNKKTASVILTGTPLKHCEFMEVYDPIIIAAMQPKPFDWTIKHDYQSRTTKDFEEEIIQELLTNDVDKDKQFIELIRSNPQVNALLKIAAKEREFNDEY